MLRFRKGGTDRFFFAFVLELQSLVVGGLVQLESDEFMGDINAAMDMHSGEAQEWEHKSHVFDWGWAWTHVPLDSTIALAWPCLPIFVSLVACEWAAIPSGLTGRWWLLGFLSVPMVKGLPRVLRGLATNPRLADIGASRPARLSARARASGAHVSDTKGNDQSNDGAPGVGVTENAIFEELKVHRGLLATGCAYEAAHGTAHAEGYCATHNFPHSVTFFH